MVTVFDPITSLRSIIGTEKYIQGEDWYCLSVENNRGDTRYVPLLTSREVHSENPPEIPYIELKIMSTPASCLSIGGDVHESNAYIDCDIVYIPNTDDIDEEFGSDVASELLDKVMESRASVGMYMEVVNDGREYYEGGGNRGIVFHRIVELYTKEIQKKT